MCIKVKTLVEIEIGRPEVALWDLAGVTYLVTAVCSLRLALDLIYQGKVDARPPHNGQDPNPGPDRFCRFLHLSI